MRIKGSIRDSIKELEVKKIFFMALAGLVSAVGITTFLAPVKLYDSGIAGTSLLLSQLTPGYLTLSLFLVILNIPLLLYGYRKEGFAFTFYSVFAVLMYSLFASVMEAFVLDEGLTSSPIAGADLLLCAVFGGLICGAGSGIAVRHGGAIDGIEVMAVIFAKKLNLTVGSFMMCYNVILYVICGLILQSWTLPLYSIVTYYVALHTIDFIAEGLDRSKSVMIITDKADKVSDALIKEFGSGTTKIPAKGGFTNKDKAIVYFVVNRFQISRMRTVVHRADPRAYITISEVADIYKYQPED
ncbi:MAG: YitT family protein [Clostridiales bacterium]|nr:YitT family protein [Clostridiales bacterium]